MSSDNGTVKDTRSYAPVFDEDVIRIELPDGNWVETLEYITEGIEAAAIREAQSATSLKMAAGNRAERRRGGGQTPESADVKFDGGKYNKTLLLRIIKAWSFKRKNGDALLVNEENIDRLPVHTREFILEYLDHQNIPVEEEKAVPFGNGSSSSSDRADTMKTPIGSTPSSITTPTSSESSVLPS